MKPRVAPTLAVLSLLSTIAQASAGDRSHEFKDCVQVCQVANCGDEATPIRMHAHLLNTR
jgi:hypothetical protein